MRAGGTLSYLLADHLGSTVEVLDAGGNTVAASETKYWPYGAIRNSGAPATDKRYTLLLAALGRAGRSSSKRPAMPRWGCTTTRRGSTARRWGGSCRRIR